MTDGVLAFSTMLATAMPMSGTTSVNAIRFKQDIKPILSKHCFSCHGAEKQKAHLRLDRRSDALKGGENGVAIVPGKSLESPLTKRSQSNDPDEMMPPKGERLSAGEIALLSRWIDEGATWPDDGSSSIEGEARQHWAFQPLIRPIVPGEASKPSHPPPVTAPDPKDSPAYHPVDSFLTLKQAELGLHPAPEASRRTLIRRATLDLTGIPPTPEEVDEFVADAAKDAYEKLIERLLASPHYGERWGRFWLDLARWAESDGYEANEIRSTAWRYRDYVVKAFNEDKPYDRFLLEQIAGDELEPYSDENLVATGFLAAARNNNNEEDKAVQLNGPLVDIANTTATVTLGLTMNCAQCHDHKFEPLSTRDYYAWHGLFLRGQANSLLLKDTSLWNEWERSKPPELPTAKQLLAEISDPVRARLQAEARARLTADEATALNTKPEQRSAEQKKLAQQLAKNIEITDEKLKQALSEDDRKLFSELQKKISRQERELTERKPQTWAFYSPATSPHTVEALPPRGQYPFPYKPDVLKTNEAVVLKRGDARNRGNPVACGVPEVFTAGGHASSTETMAAFTNRQQLVKWLVSEKNPLAARVWVNFVWQQHFGRGLVNTSGDFGLKGERPANQALLDWLACEFRQPGSGSNDVRSWSTKQLHRLIMLSAAYRRQSISNASNAKIDPDNRHLWRWMPRRLEGEAIRDSFLAVANQLNRTLGGPSVNGTNGPSNRRSLYLRQQRYILPAALAMFDAPVANEACTRRHTSTVPLQPLHLLNNAENLSHAEAFAARVMEQAADDDSKRIESAFELALMRPPSAEEVAAARKLFEAIASTGDNTSPPIVRRASGTVASANGAKSRKPSPELVQFCQALMNSNEFVFIQ